MKFLTLFLFNFLIINCTANCLVINKDNNKSLSINTFKYKDSLYSYTLSIEKTFNNKKAFAFIKLFYFKDSVNNLMKIVKSNNYIDNSNEIFYQLNKNYLKNDFNIDFNVKIYDSLVLIKNNIITHIKGYCFVDAFFIENNKNDFSYTNGLTINKKLIPLYECNVQNPDSLINKISQSENKIFLVCKKNHYLLFKRTTTVCRDCLEKSYLSAFYFDKRKNRINSFKSKFSVAYLANARIFDKPYFVSNDMYWFEMVD